MALTKMGTQLSEPDSGDYKEDQADYFDKKSKYVTTHKLLQKFSLKFMGKKYTRI